MKNTLIAAIALIIAVSGCKKKDDNPTPSNKVELAKITTNVDAQDSLRIVVSYTDKNTAVYYDDLLKVYVDDKYVTGTTIDPHKPNTSFKYTPSMVFKGSKYKVEITREHSPGDKEVIVTYEGTK